MFSRHRTIGIMRTMQTICRTAFKLVDFNLHLGMLAVKLKSCWVFVGTPLGRAANPRAPTYRLHRSWCTVGARSLEFWRQKIATQKRRPIAKRMRFL